MPTPTRRDDGPQREREFLEDGSEVTWISDRDLVLRAVNSTLRTEHALGKLMGEVAKLARRVGNDPAPVHQLREVVRDAVGEAVEDAVEEVTGRHDSDRVREIAKSVTNEDKLAELRDARDFRLKVAAQVIAGVLVFVLAYFFGRMTAGH